MANIDAPRGFVPVAHLSGGLIRTRGYLADEDSDTIYPGDGVTLQLTGKVSRADAGDPLIGIAAEYRATMEGQYLLVYDDPNIIYEVQGYTGVTFAIGHVGEKADLVATAGSSSTKMSLEELNDPEAPTAQFVILGLVNRPDNAWGEHAKMLVKIFEHQSSYIATS